MTEKEKSLWRIQIDVPKHKSKIAKSVLIFAMLVLAVLLAYSAGIAQPADKDPELVRAASQGDLKEVISLLDLGADVNAGGDHDWTPLTAAAGGGHLNSKDVEVKIAITKFFIAALVLLFIFVFSKSEPDDSNMFPRQKWTLRDAYKAVVYSLCMIFYFTILMSLWFGPPMPTPTQASVMFLK